MPSSDEQRYLVILGFTLVWGVLIARIADPTRRQLLCLLPSAFLCGIFGLWHVPASSVALYCLLRAMPRPLAPATSLVFAFGVQLALRLSPAGLEGIANGLYLVLTLRHGALGFHLSDGAKVPGSLFEHLAYTLSFYGLFTMPYLTFAQHEAAVRLGYLSCDWRGASRALGRAACFAAVYLALQKLAPLSLMGTSQFEQRLPRLSARLLYMLVAMSQVRFRFYCAWSIAECAGLLFGLPAAIASSMHVPTVELGTVGRRRIRAWNTSVSRWFVDIVYTRLPAPAVLRQLAVCFVSAWWHDTRPFQLRYYLFFCHLPLCVLACNATHAHVVDPLVAWLRRHGAPNFARCAVALAFLHETCMFVFFNVAFVSRDVQDVLAKWSQLGWYGQGALALALGTHLLSLPWAGRGARPASKTS